MMRNSINTYLSALVMVLALLLSANAFALTQSSPITIDGKEYTLFTGFTAIDGSDVASGKVFSNMVDGNLSSEWHPIGQPNSSESYSSLGYAYLEFSSDVPIAIKGFILNSFNEKYYLPSEMRLLAKADEQADYVEISSYTDLSYTGTEKSFSVDNAQNNQYSFFRLECTNKSKNIWMTEIRLYAGDDLTYGFMPKKSATCTETGIKQACYLRSDGKYFTDETGTTEIPKEDAFDPIKPHDLIHHEEDDAHYEYWECSVCGKKFGDAEGSRELDDFDFYHVYTKLRKLVISSDNMVLIDFDDTHSNNVKYKVVGDVITFRVLEKYVDVNSIKVSDGINDYPITSEGNGNYSFTVPAADVTISVEKKPKYEGLSFFEIVTYVDRNTVTTDIFHSGLSTIRLNSGIVYNIYEGNNTYFNEDEGRFGGAHSGFSVPKTGWYDISFNEVGDGKWNLSISATTRKPQIETISDQVYTGEDIMPKPVVTLDLYDLTEGTDYEYSYTNNVNVGASATVTVTFKGDYAEFGSVSKSFNITKATPTVEPPTSADPKFAGACVALVASGSSNSGDMLYSVLREGGAQTAYSTEIPCADRAGNYTVYYKVEESDNWFGFAPQSVDVTVENEMFKITFVDDEGDEIISREYEYGTPAEGVDLPPENPEKADDEMYAYTFAGWSPEIQDVTGAKTYRPIYGKTRIGFGPITIAKDSSSAIIDGMSRDPIDKAIKDCMIKGEVTLYRHFAAGKYSTLVLPFSTFTGAFSGVSFYSFRGVEKENGVWKTVVFGYVDKENEGNKLIEANTPYIVVADADMDDLVVKDGVLFNADDPKSSYGATLTCSEETCDEVPDENKSWQFVGTYNYRQWDSGNNVEEIGTTYGFAGAAGNGGMEIGKFGKIKEGAYIYPMRAYLRYAGGNSGESRSMAPALFKAAPAYASVASIDELPESMDVVIRGEEGTTVIGTINTRTGEFRSADNRWFDLNGRYLGNKKPTVKGTYYNNGKKVIVK